MTTLEYIAVNDEHAARAVCSKHGYDLQNVNNYSDLAACLEQLTAEVGEPAFVDILSLHPDKDLIIEAFSGTEAQGKKKCPCEKKNRRDAYQPVPSSQIKESHIMIFAGFLIIAAAIVAKN